MTATISPNTAIAQYTIVSKIGEGGMGEVWRARDAKLGRDVAIKVLPTSLSENPDRLNRFEQEAQAAGALNHPNILVIHHIGLHNGAPYIVSELLEGETLRDRLAAGALPQRKATNYALQIAKGLAAAHEKGIVHRDIKPDNIFITEDGRVKILDFGLAKLTATVDGLEAQTDVPTRKVNTNPGTVMGTVGYMSPEQLKGKQVDHRSDIFSFGAILYEMLSGKRAFRGDSMAETMSAILREDPPDLSHTNKTTSPALERVVRHCLEKNPSERFHSARDLAFAIESLSGSALSSGPTTIEDVTTTTVKESSRSGFFRSAPIAWLIATVCVVGLLIVLALVYFKSPSPTSFAMRLAFNPPSALTFNDVLPDWAVISPDGQRIAFSATDAAGKNMLYVKEFDSHEAKLLPGSDNPLEPFWSPDSRSIAYGSNGKLKRSDLSGGNAQVLCDSARLVGGSWSKDGVLVFAPDYRKPLVQVSANGGEPTPVAMTPEEGYVERHRYPYFLPDGRRFLFYRDTKGIWAGSLDSPEIKQVVPDNSPAVYSKDGSLIFIRNDALVAQAFDQNTLALSGEPVPIITDQKVWINNFRFSASDTGTLVWQGTWERDYQLVWYDREGKQVGSVEDAAKVAVGQDPRISPDGKRIVIKRSPPNTIWVIDTQRGNSVRITSDFGQMPVWSPDGSRLVYSGSGGLHIKASNGLGDAEALATTGAPFPCSWSPDGRYIIFLRRGVKTRLDMYAVSLDGERNESLLLNSPFDENSPTLSLDGKWLAYAADDTGSPEIYVQSFADGKLGSDRKRISTAGGRMPVWNRNGSELYFLAPDGHLMSSSAKSTANEIEFSHPTVLFKTRMLGRAGAVHEFDVSPDGQRFLIGTLVGESKSPPPTVIMNWTALMKK